MGCTAVKSSSQNEGTGQKVDAMFLCDCTQSMSPFLESSKATIKKLSEDFKKDYPDVSLRIGFIGYRDHGDKEPISCSPLSDDIKAVDDFIKECKCYGGGDIPEAVEDALALVIQTPWRPNSLRFVIHILDAPPHGKEYTHEYDKCENGCPNGYDCKDLLKTLSEQKTMYIMYTFGKLLNETIEIFKKNHTDFKANPLDGEKLTEEEKEELKKYRGADYNLKNRDKKDEAGDAMISRATAAISSRVNEKRDKKH